MAEVKGVLVNAMRMFLVDRYGKSAIDQALTALDPNDASLIQNRFLDSSFYPYATMDALRRLARALSASRPMTLDEPRICTVSLAPDAPSGCPSARRGARRGTSARSA